MWSDRIPTDSSSRSKPLIGSIRPTYKRIFPDSNPNSLRASPCGTGVNISISTPAGITDILDSGVSYNCRISLDSDSVKTNIRSQDCIIFRSASNLNSDSDSPGLALNFVFAKVWKVLIWGIFHDLFKKSPTRPDSQ